MKNTITSIAQDQKTKKEVRIGNTVFDVTIVYNGQQEFEKMLFEWALQKTLQAIKS